jgi:choline-sulfatase
MSEPEHGKGIGRRSLFSAASSLVLTARAGVATARPNILYVITDQQHAGMMSCTGNRWLKTPVLDSLAAAGTRFELAYSANPVCVPARTSMMTGRYPSHFGILGNKAAPVPEEALPAALGHLFRRAGYRTVFGGKTHWPRPMTPQSIGFEYLTNDERDELADTCARFLRQKHEQPFLMVASFINPHDICLMAIDAYTKASNLPPMYPKLEIERQRVAEALSLPRGVSREEFFRKHCPPLPANHGPTMGEPDALGRYGSFRGYVRKHWTVEDWRMHRWAYCRLTERVDAEIGRVLSALRETGLDRNTLVVFSSDHGDMDAAHGFEHKSLSYEESARVPFIVAWPGHTPRRVDTKHFVSASIDLLPTLCDYASIEAPQGLPGRSVRALVERGWHSRWREDVAIECPDSRCLRTPRYKYTVFEGAAPRELLTDMEKDPGEMTNLAADHSFADVLTDHRRRLRQRCQELNDGYGLSLLDLAPSSPGGARR